MSGEGRKVLIVDDEEDVREFVRVALEDDGYDFVTADNGEKAVKKAKSEKPDVIVMDVQMPVMDGFKAFAELRADEATRSIPIIMLTAVAERTGIKFDAKDMGEYLGSEPEAYIDKPIDPDKLRDTVKAVL